MFAPPIAKPKSLPRDRRPAAPQPSIPMGVARAQELRRRIGNQGMIRLLAQGGSEFRSEPVPIQAKLKVGAVSDPLEHEADRVADQVMRMPASEVSVANAPPQVSRKCAECEAAEKLQREPTGPQTVNEAPAIVHEVLRSPGQPLDAATRAYFEPRFGQDFSRVRIHADAQAQASARAVDARAFTVGPHIAFADRQSAASVALMAHELSHVIQQGSSTPHRDRLRASPDPERRIQRQAADMSAAHAGGAMGEPDAAFALGKLGFNIVIGPAGPQGHQLTAPGLDIVAYHPQSNELWIVDNKASGGTSTVDDASAITTNLHTNITKAASQVQDMPEFPGKAAVLLRLQVAQNALAQNQPVPSNVQLVVLNAGGYHSDVSAKLKQLNIRFVDVTGTAVRTARKRDVKAARAAGVAPGRPTTKPMAQGGAPASPDVAGPSLQGAPTSNARRAGSIVASGAVGLGGSIATLLLNEYLQEHFADYRRQAMQESTSRALDKAAPEFAAKIKRHNAEIKTAQAQGRKVYLYVVVETLMVDAADSGISIGFVPATSVVVDVQVHLEGDARKTSKEAHTSIAGDLLRGATIGALLDYSEQYHLIPGTDFDERRRNEVIDLIQQTMSQQALEFDELVLRSRFGGLPRDVLREYARTKRERAAIGPDHASNRQKNQRYWTRMEQVVDAPLEDVIQSIKIRSGSLDQLRSYATQMRGADSQDDAPWADIIAQIDAPLSERSEGERQRATWERGPTADEISRQEQVVASLEREVAALERQLAAMAENDARIPQEIAANEPPHPPWSKMTAARQEIARLRENIEVEKHVLDALEKEARQPRAAVKVAEPR